ncbi:MAG: chromate transporter family protein [Hyphomicrobiales bacterium]|nr:chromate transporter family protein [Hyphomicrobiales bacterium]
MALDVPAEATRKEEGPQAPPLSQIFWSFLKVGASAFGGSTQALIHREAVERRHWLDEQAFLAGFAISQVLPGANPVNLALYIGLKARGGLGATVAVVAMIIPAFCIIMAMGFVYGKLSGMPVTHFVLGGVAAAGVGATLSVGAKVVSRLPRNFTPFLVAAAVFASVGILRWPMVPVVLVAVPLSVLLAYLNGREARS